MFLPALVGVVGLLVMAGAPPASAAEAEQAPRYDPALEVTIDSLMPAYLPEDGPVRVTGSVTNADDVPWAAINIYAFIGDAPMVTQAELEAAAASDPLLAVGERITDTAASDKIETLQPGETKRFSLTVPRSLLPTAGAGVYWFGVHALGESVNQPRDPDAAVADGRARTLLPYVPPGTPGSVKTALVLPIRHFLPYVEDGSLDALDHWRRTLDIGGRLRDLVDFAASAGSTPVSWLVDPALPDAIRRIGLGNPPRSLAPSDPVPDEEPDETPSDTPSESADPDESSPTEPELTADEQEAADAAVAWLGRFEEAVQGDEVLALPYGDLDVAAAAELDPGLYTAARERPSAVLSAWGIDTLPTITSPTGYLNEAGFEMAPDDTTVMVTDEVFRGDAPGVAEIDDKLVAVMSSGAAAGGPGPGDRFTSVQLRQRILSEAAVRLLSPGRHPLVVSMPTEWDPGEAASAFFAGLDVDWLELTTVGDAIDRDGTLADAADLEYPATQQRRQLDQTSFTAVRDLISAGETLQNVLTLNTQVSETVTDQALSGASYGARETPLTALRALLRSTAWIADQLDDIEISAGPGVTLSGRDGGFATVITNRLDQPVTVNVVARSNGGVEIAPTEPVELAANSRSTVVLDAHANRVGVTNVTLSLTDVDGNALGASDELPIRSAQVSAVIWVIIGTGLALLFLAILVRLVRRIRGGHGEPPTSPNPTTLEATP